MKYDNDSYDFSEVRQEIDMSGFPGLEVSITFDVARESDENFLFKIGVGGSIISSPLLHKGVLYFGCADKNFYAVTVGGEQLWRFPTQGQILSTAKVMDDTIYFGSYDGAFYALDLRGRLKWKFETNDKIFSVPCVTEDRVYFGSKDNNIYCCDRRTGRELWRFPTKGTVKTTTIFRDNNIYFGSDDCNIYSLRADDGRLVWNIPLGDASMGTNKLSSYVFRDMFIIPLWDKTVNAISFEGKVVWTYNSDDVAYSAAVYGDRVYFGSRSGNLHCLDAQTGKKRWTFHTNGYVVGDPLVFRDRVYITSQDGNLYCLSMNGELVWKCPTGGVLTSSPNCDDNGIYFGSWDCNLYAVSHEGKLLWRFPTSLSYQSPIELESLGQREVSHQVTWSSESSEKDKYDKGLPNRISDYGERSGDYQAIGARTSYMSSPEKKYKTKGKYGA